MIKNIKARSFSENLNYSGNSNHSDHLSLLTDLTDIFMLHRRLCVHFDQFKFPNLQSAKHVSVDLCCFFIAAYFVLIHIHIHILHVKPYTIL